MRYCEICCASFQERRTCPRDGIPTRVDIGDPLVGAVLGERYRVLDRIASGGMGHVYRAAHTRMACVFAVKVLYGDLAYDGTMRARFEREGEVASLLQSRYIVRVVDFSQSDSGLLYLAMEYLDGETLFDTVERHGPLAPARALTLAMQVAIGLAHAHERGVVHRDLKGENVIVVREDDDEIPKILDFGVARLRTRDTEPSAGRPALTAARDVLGTPAYMAPEQFAGGEVDARADLYALGVMLHTLVTGQLPFDSSSTIDLMRQHLTEPAPSLVSRVGSSPLVEAMEPLQAKLLAKKRDDRYGNARDFIADARAILEHRPRSRTEISDVSARRSGASIRAAAPVPSVDGSLLEAIRGAIVLGAPTYNSGDHSGCYEIYRGAAMAQIARTNPPLGLAERARLEVALGDAAKARGPTLAAWTLRHAFDDLTTAVTAPTLPPRDTADAAIDVFQAVSARVYALGHADCAYRFHGVFATLLREGLTQLARRSDDVSLLDACLRDLHHASADTGPTLVAEALERIRGERAGSRPRALETGPTVVGPPPTRVPEVVRQAMLRAIKAGVPAYNAGDHATCAREYQRTAEAIVGETKRNKDTQVIAAWLDPITTRAKAASPHDAAWMLRHAFDALLGLP